MNCVSVQTTTALDERRNEVNCFRLKLKSCLSLTTVNTMELVELLYKWKYPMRRSAVILNICTTLSLPPSGQQGQNCFEEASLLIKIPKYWNIQQNKEHLSYLITKNMKSVLRGNIKGSLEYKRFMDGMDVTLCTLHLVILAKLRPRNPQ